MATFKYYLLPADHCETAIFIHEAYKTVAIQKKDAVLRKYKAHGITYKGDQISLYWKWCAPEKALEGFTDTKWNPKEEVWFQSPKRTTLIGKRTYSEILKVCKLNLHLESSLEKALGIDGHIFGMYQGQKCFLSTQAIPLEDGRVVIRFPVLERGRDFYTRNKKEEPVLPFFAVEISIDEAEQLVGEPIQ